MSEATQVGGGCVACNVKKVDVKRLEGEFIDRIYNSDGGKLVWGFFRRCWSLSPILLGLFNTVTNIQSIAESLAMVGTPSDWNFGQGTFLASSRSREGSYGPITDSNGASYLCAGNTMSAKFMTCAYGQPMFIKQGCDYEIYSAYQALLIIWCVYFFGLGFFHFCFSFKYSTFDMRYCK